MELGSCPAMVEEVGAVECGLAAMELSPDLEIVVLVTKEMKVFISQIFVCLCNMLFGIVVIYFAHLILLTDMMILMLHCRLSR